ncbi:hypothetical protein KSS87_016641 [Heliosperma pusillum]|nr:hypothetical protein KSS87_016641 [Heliosperma pusillum]
MAASFFLNNLKPTFQWCDLISYPTQVAQDGGDASSPV